VIYLVNALLVSGTAFLLLFGEHIATRIRARRESR
jgi:hypothetical protein